MVQVLHTPQVLNCYIGCSLNYRQHLCYYCFSVVYSDQRVRRVVPALFFVFRSGTQFYLQND